MRHRRILDIAEERPDATLETIADEVSSATVDLVERVLDEYGDPAADPPATQNMNDADYPDPDEFTEKERETLRAIYDNPEATQRELANTLGVAGATINNRVNAIEGFSWENRQEFVDEVFGSASTAEGDGMSQIATNGTETEARIDQLTDRVAALERTVDELADHCKSDTPVGAPDFAHKVVHACMKSDTITEEEELRLLKEFL